MTYINKHFIVIILSYNLIIISTIFGSPIEDKEYLRLGDEAEVLFTFMHRPEYIKEGEKLVFRDGMTKGVGHVLELFSEDNFNKK